MRALSGRRSRAALSLLVVAGAFIAPVVATSPPAAAAPGAPRAATAAAPAAPLQVTQASARAHATGAPVVVGSLTTATSQTTALPDGQLRVTESLEPVRTMRAGTWVTLNPRLQKAAGDRIAPAVTTRPLSLSDGGAGPLAVLDNYGRTLTLTWPGGKLPAPVVTGATATYPNVEPGIDLAVTATSQGDISEVAVIRDAAAATGPGLAAALRIHASGPGLTVTTGEDGAMEATTGPGADPAFASAAPQVWDSAAPPAGTRTETVDGATVVAPSGMPADSTATGPGAYAHVYTATQSASDGTITVAPPAASLHGSGVIYPVFVDPAWAGVPVSTKAAAWTMLESGYPTATGWDQSGAPYLEVGYCDPNNLSGCNGIGVTRSMFRFNLPSEPAGSTVSSADVYVDDLWSSADCAAEPLELWSTPAISSGTDWSNGSSWSKDIEEENIAGYGSSSSCPSSANDVKFGSGTTATGSTSAGTLASTLTSSLDGHQSTITLGLRAADESTTDGSAWLQWRYFQDTAADITMSYTYHYPPAAPKMTIEPAGDCQTTAASADADPIGDDDITIDGTISDADGDTGLTTKTTVYNSGNTFVEGPWTYGPGAGVTGQTLGTIARGKLTTGTYHVTAVTTDSFSETASSTCYFYVDLTAPGRPVVAGLPATTTLGAQLTGLTFSPAAGQTCTSTPDPCPTTYTYQIGDRSPVTVKVTNTTTDVYVQPSTSPITVPVVGPFDFSVSGTNAAGNASPASVTVVTSTAPTTPVADGYFTNGSYPDLLTTDTAATDASLWLSPGTGNGKVGPATDIGGLGTAQNPGSDGPADWNDTQVVQGDFTGNNVQDILAYYTTASSTVTPGTGVIIGGTGSAVPPNPNSGSNYIDPASGNAWEIAEDYQDFCDPSFAISCPPLADVAYAGNASLEGSTNDGTNSATNNSDVIGIFGPNSSGDYELDLFTALDTSVYGLDGVHGVLSTTSPDGTDDWQDYTLATVELPDTANPNGDPSDIALFALNNTVGSPDAGKLYVSTGSGCTSATFTTSACLLPGMAGTWSTAVTGTPSSWTTTPPKLDSADVNSGSGGAGSGTPEIWTVSGSTATAYAISGIGGTPSAAAEGSGSSLTYPNDSWALNDGAANAGDSPAAVTDSVTGASDSITGTGYSWADDNSFGEALDTTASYFNPTTNPIPNDGTAATISLWFKTTGTNEVLVARQGQPIPAGTAVGAPVTGSFNPVLYVGNDGKLCFQWWVNDISSTQCNTTVNNGLWHHATLAANGDTQTLTLDNLAAQTITGEVSLSTTYIDIGAGSLGGSWPDEIYENKDGSQGYMTYFNGEIADATLTK
jgi:hypothetical protein